MVKKILGNVCFRTKGGHKQGMGDVTGSVFIAREFSVRGYSVNFIIDDDTETAKFIKSYGYVPIIVENRNEKRAWEGKYFDIVIVNQLKSPAKLLRFIRTHCGTLVTIDDTTRTSRKLADIRINPLYYDKWAHCGSEYVPLNRIFRKAHRYKKRIERNIKHLLVTMGGSDTYGFTPQIINALSKIPDDIDIKIVIGPAFKHNIRLSEVLLKAKRRFVLLRNINSKEMYYWMRWADLAISSAGNTLFEMACCGTPVIAICAEPFEEETAFRFAKSGFGMVTPFAKAINLKRLKVFMEKLKSKELRKSYSRAGQRQVSGLGVKKIVEKILEFMKR